MTSTFIFILYYILLSLGVFFVDLTLIYFMISYVLNILFCCVFGTNKYFLFLLLLLTLICCLVSSVLNILFCCVFEEINISCSCSCC